MWSRWKLRAAARQNAEPSAVIKRSASVLADKSKIHLFEIHDVKERQRRESAVAGMNAAVEHDRLAAELQQNARTAYFSPRAKRHLHPRQ